MDEVEKSNRAKLARMDDDALVAELEAALEIKDEAEMQGDTITYMQQFKYVSLIEEEIALREALVEDLALIAA